MGWAGSASPPVTLKDGRNLRERQDMAEGRNSGSGGRLGRDGEKQDEEGEEEKGK